jgi:TRAP-type C4-dicarboxylate transport system permease small subunit
MSTSRIFEILIRGLLILSSLAGFGMVLIVLLSVFQRYVLKSPLSFSEELVGLLLCSMLFLSLPYISYSEKHVKINLVVNLLSDKAKSFASILSSLVMITFCFWMLVETITWMNFAIRLDLKTENSRLILYPWMGVIPLALLINIFISFKKIYKIFN